VRSETTPLVESAVREAAAARWTVSGNVTFEVIEAFTRKADGTVIPADRNDFVTQDGAVGVAMSFVDLKVHQIPFRDLSVGDTTVLTVRLTEKEHYIPGQYSYPVLLTPSAAKRSVDVTLRAPVALEIGHDEQQLAYEEVNAGDEIVRRWSGSAEPITTEEKDVANLALLLPFLRFSTFRSFEAIAAGYYESAKPKLAVTPEIERLAREITAGKQNRRAEAEAIFDWVSRNISYVAVYFGNGRYVPNDTHTILSRRFGDCKDQATLLGALLAAKGIESEQVLISLDPTYELPKTPMLQAFNHVIVYVPEFDRYLDPTVAFGSFDHPPSRDLGKPVLRVSGAGAKLARTPTVKIDDNVVMLDTRMTMTREGHRGQTTIEARGEFADSLRAFLVQVETKGKDVELANLAKFRGLLGTFALEAPPWTEKREPVRVTTKWEAQQPFNLVQAGWHAQPAFSPMVPHPNLFFGGLEPHSRVYPAICRAGRIMHILDVALPEGMVPGALPQPIEQRAPQFSFRQQWAADGNHLRVRTEISSFVKGMVCTPDAINAVRTAYGAIEQRTNPVLTFGSSSIWQVKPGASNNSTYSNPNCRPGGDQVKCLQGLGLRTFTAQAPPAGTSTTPNDGQPRPSTAVKPVELSRVVPIDQKRQIDFLSSINPDCSPVGSIVVRIIEQPHDGKVFVENGTGFTNYPFENQRYECNKRKSEGVLIFYEPRPAFAGADSIMLDVIFPSGAEMKRHYSVEVK
jgi:transglutaminase-like putative cysteine protease